jgi:hypothetical protein
MRMILFNFSDIRLLCFRGKFSKDNWAEYQYKLGQKLKPMNSSFHNRLESNTNQLKENRIIPGMT